MRILLWFAIVVATNYKKTTKSQEAIKNKNPNEQKKQQNKKDFSIKMPQDGHKKIVFPIKSLQGRPQNPKGKKKKDDKKHQKKNSNWCVTP